jgi:hypothetical protein
VTTFSVLLRVLADGAAEGRVVGQAEVVDTGELVALTGTGSLLELLRRLASGGPGETDPSSAAAP